jgi:biotin transport system substrate-specific component
MIRQIGINYYNPTVLIFSYTMNDVKITSSKSHSISTKNLVITGMFTAVICVMSQISIPVQPIPFTFSLLAIFLTGALLPPRYAFLSALVYLLLGAFGLPVYAGLSGGLHILIGMTGGYLMAYPLMSFITALVYKYFKRYKLLALATGMLLSLLLCYLMGTAWFSYLTEQSFYTALTICVFPFIPFDILKIVLACSFSIIIRKSIFKASFK